VSDFQCHDSKKLCFTQIIFYLRLVKKEKGTAFDRALQHFIAAS